MLETIFGVVSNVINFVISALASVINLVLSVLPDSPFLDLNFFDSDVFNYIPYLSYLFPLASMFATFSAWLVCMLVYYIYSIVMRWIKLM